MEQIFHRIDSILCGLRIDDRNLAGSVEPVLHRTRRRRRRDRIVMLIYLDQAMAELTAERDAEACSFTRDDLRKAIINPFVKAGLRS